MQEDIREWGRAIDEGLTTENNPPINLAQKLFERKTGNKKKEQLTSEASTPSTPGVVNQFYIDPIGSRHRRLSTPPAASLLDLKSSPIAPLPRTQGVNRLADLREYFEWHKKAVEDSEAWQQDVEAAYQVAFTKRWDLKTIREQKPNKQGKTPNEVMIEEGVPEAIAERLQADIKEWRSLRGVLGGDLESLGLGQ
jgi:hypothetical protein